MKHIKTYKIFENLSSDVEETLKEICYDVTDDGKIRVETCVDYDLTAQSMFDAREAFSLPKGIYGYILFNLENPRCDAFNYNYLEDSIKRIKKYLGVNYISFFVDSQDQTWHKLKYKSESITSLIIFFNIENTTNPYIQPKVFESFQEVTKDDMDSLADTLTTEVFDEFNIYQSNPIAELKWDMCNKESDDPFWEFSNYHFRDYRPENNRKCIIIGNLDSKKYTQVINILFSIRKVVYGRTGLEYTIEHQVYNRLGFINLTIFRDSNKYKDPY